jgi:predicted nucleic acid-binding protein
MSAEFVDTNILIYAHDGGAGTKHTKSVAMLDRLFEEGSGALSIQVLTEFYAAATRKLNMKPEEAEEIIRDLEGWTLHRPSFADLLSASGLHRRYKISWWDALIVNSATELGCSVLWSEDLADGQKYGSLIVRNPF